MSGARLIELNPNETPLTSMSDIIVRAPAGASLPALVERVRRLAAA
jgi:NAD-dependent SIR2 family protein deacetylase